jgi:hypothetical protein
LLLTGTLLSSSTMPSNRPFSQRLGYSAEHKEITVREGVPEKLRYWVLETVRGLDWNASQVRDVMCRALLDVPDRNAPNDYIIWEECRWRVSACEWFKVYDIIEAFHSQLRKDDLEHGLGGSAEASAPQFAEAINRFLVENGIGWQLLDGAVVSRGDEAFEAAVKGAVGVMEADAKPTAASHLRFAIDALSARPKADTSGAVAHATSAVECLLNVITGEALTLGKYLDRHPDLFHPALKKGLDGIYGYASDEGARHGKEGTEPTREDAEFVVARRLLWLGQSLPQERGCPRPNRATRPCHGTVTVIDLLKLVLESQPLTVIVCVPAVMLIAVLTSFAAVRCA